MELVKGNKHDIDELEKLYDELTDYLECHINYPGWRKGIYPAREDAVAGVGEENLYVIRQEGRIIGTVILSHKPETGYSKADWQNNLDYEDIFVIHTLAIHPLRLKQGIGKQFLEQIVEYCREMGAKAIRLDVYEKNIPAISLYKKCGFQYIDTVDLGYGEYGLDNFELYQKLL